MKTRLILIGGFLGAGKTTLMLKAARILRDQGITVGLVTNDQGDDLVDTALAKRMDLSVTEVAGGCFCCNFDDLMKSIETLKREVNPAVILAEPVGSCTDLVATVMRPIKHYYPDEYELAPLTILTDVEREAEKFDSDVEYLYDRQLAEADIIALSKSDREETPLRKEARRKLQATYPGARLMELSGREEESVREWLDLCLHQVSNAQQSLEIDYALYARAEASLGWLNAAGVMRKEGREFRPTSFIVSFMSAMEDALRARTAEIAHLKIYMSTPGHTAFKASLTRVGEPLSWDIWNSNESTGEANFLVNARVHREPAELEMLLRTIYQQVAEDYGVEYHFSEFECFSPAPPEPTHRLTLP